MASLTGAFQHNRGANNRLKKYFSYIGAFLVVVAIGVGAYFLYDNKVDKISEKQTSENQSKYSILPSAWLIKYFGHDRENDADIGGVNGDPDGDILTNYQEFYFNTDPTNPDTDGDGQIDSIEIATNSNPLGDGELYKTDYTKEVADRYFDDVNLQKFKQENIEKYITELLNPPSDEDVVISLPDTTQLTILAGGTDEQVEEYVTRINNLVEANQMTPELMLRLAQENVASDDITVMIGNIYKTIDQLRGVPVPTAFVTFHQLQIAGLFASARMLEISLKYDPLVEMEEQPKLLREQYYQVAVMEKIDKLMQAEYDLLKPEYKNILEKVRG